MARRVAVLLALVVSFGVRPSAADDYPRWPIITVAGVQPMVLRRGVATIIRPAQARADRIIVVLRQRPDGRPWTPDEACQAVGRPVARLWPELSMASVVVDPAEVRQALEHMRGRPVVEKADYDYIVYPAYVPDTPEFRQQYHHQLIRTPEAWDILSPSQYPAVVIAMVDTGLDLDHPDFRGKIWTNAGEIPNNNKDDDKNGFVDDVNGWDFYHDNNDPRPDPDGRDENGDGEADEQVSHGTLGAGLAGAAVFDNWGTAGVYPNARIMPIQVFPDDGGTDYETVVEGINYAINNGADIINLSIGAPWSDLFTPPIVRAHQRGIVVVAAAGNDATALTDTYWRSPVCNDGNNPLLDNFVIGVAYTDRNDRKGSYSNWDTSTGKHFVDVSAPGEGVYGPAYHNPAFPAFTSYFGTNTGTSFAAPMVAGLAALLKALHPSWTPDTLLARIRQTADNIDRLNPGYAGKLGAGRINCARAVGVAIGPRPPQNLRAFDTPHDNGGSITLTWELSPDDAAGAQSVTGYIILRRDGTEGTFSRIGEVSAGVDNYVDSGLSNGAQYYYKVGATDGKNVSYAGPVGPVSPADDLAPPPVTPLHVYDRPSDQGGAIILDWTDYQPPADFKEYRIYRDRWYFTQVGSRQPIAVIPDPATKRYVDAELTDFTDYYYAVTCADQAGNEERNVTPAGPVQSIPNDLTEVGPGLYLWSAPAVPSSGDPRDLFGDSGYMVAGWDSQAGRYATYTPGAALVEAAKARLGRGLWIALRATKQVRIAG
ncbi:MAG: S8 family serine peptidase, partial [Armatimonadetes bacterium]|nr:S8 family serine peptidase [Armatimonadota bacterium]